MFSGNFEQVILFPTPKMMIMMIPYDLNNKNYCWASSNGRVRLQAQIQVEWADDNCGLQSLVRAVSGSPSALIRAPLPKSEQLPSLPPPLHPSRPFPLPLAPFPSERGCVQEVSIRVAPLLKVFRDTGDVTQTRPANELAIRWSVGRKVTLASLLTSVCLSGRIRVRLQSPEVPGSKHLSPSILDLNIMVA